MGFEEEGNGERLGNGAGIGGGVVRGGCGDAWGDRGRIRFFGPKDCGIWILYLGSTWHSCKIPSIKWDRVCY